MTKSKASVLLSLILVFVSGAVVGAFSYRLYLVPAVQTTGGTGGPGGPPPRMSPEEVRRKIVADMTKAVKLDADQVTKLNAIMDQTHQEMDKLREKGKPEWDAFKQQSDALMQKREALAEKWRPEQDAVRSRQADQINAMLREDQRPLYAAWRAERDRQRKLREQRDPHKKQ
jgi:hypothetical protein